MVIAATLVGLLPAHSPQSWRSPGGGHAAKEARGDVGQPCPIISRVSDVLVEPVMASATRAESRLSMAARMATARQAEQVADRRGTQIGMLEPGGDGEGPMVGTTGGGVPRSE